MFYSFVLFACFLKYMWWGFAAYSYRLLGRGENKINCILNFHLEQKYV